MATLIPLHVVGAFFVYCVLGWVASCGNGPECFLSKGVGAGPIVTQLGPVCAQTCALSARSKLTANRIVSDKLRQTNIIIIIIKTEYFDYLNKWLCNPYL